MGNFFFFLKKLFKAPSTMGVEGGENRFYIKKETPIRFHSTYQGISVVPAFMLTLKVPRSKALSLCQISVLENGT